MKNIKRLFVAAMVISASSMAALLQPALPMSEGTGCRVSAGVFTNGGKMGTEYGLSNVMGGLNFTHFAGYDFFYGIGVAGGVSTGDKRLFTSEAKDRMGAAVEGELSAGFLPELAERLHLGVLVGVGYGHVFHKASNDKAKEHGVKFGDLNVKAGIAFSFGFTDSVHLYLAPTYALTAIRFFNEGTLQQYKKTSNQSGFQLPVGVSFHVADDVAMFVETTTKLNNLMAKDVLATWQQELAVGVSFGM